MKKTKQSEPLNEFLEMNRRRKPVSFHMPGHKYGRFPYGKKAHEFASFDITEIPDADNIQKPNGIIKKSLEMISEAYGSDKTIFITNGATGGILAIMKYFSQSGGRVIVSRDCHSSVVNGAILFNVSLEFIPVQYNDGIPLPVTADAVKKAVDAVKECSGVIITSPNYYGLVASIGEIGSFLKSRNILLAVDEAHGAHFAFSGLGEFSGLNNGADIVCHSLHKTMPVYNQGALLHIKGNSVDDEKLCGIVRMLGTSSPSYPILASMEKAVAYYRQHGTELYRKLAVLVEITRMNLLKKGFKCLPNDDFSRLVIDVSAKNANGYRMFERLCESGVYLEACDSRYLTAITTPSNRKRDFIALERAIGYANMDLVNDAEGPFLNASWQLPQKAMDIHEAILCDRHPVPMDRAAGSICGTIIIPYPPGVPCLYPGEVITGETALHIKTIVDGGGVVLGLDRGMIPVLE